MKWPRENEINWRNDNEIVMANDVSLISGILSNDNNDVVNAERK